MAVSTINASGHTRPATSAEARNTIATSGEQTVSNGASVTISHDAISTPPIVTGWKAAAAPTEWKLLIHGDAFPFTDAVGNTVNNTGCTLDSSSTPVGNGSILFEPAGDRLTVTPSGYTWQAQWTLECWVNPAAIGAQSGGRWIIGRLSGSTSVFGLILASDGSGNVGLYLSSDGSSWNIVEGTTVATMSAGTWYHVVIQRDATHYAVYINGSRTANISSGAALYSSTIALTFANHPDAGVSDGKFTGKITEIALRATAAYSGSSLTVPSTRYDVTSSRDLLAHGVDFSVAVNSTGTQTTITNTSGASYTASFYVDL